MTQLAIIPRPKLTTRAVPVLAALASGALSGAALGVAARAWMRFIAEDPEFTWNGTIFIVGAFTVCGLAQAVTTVIVHRTGRTWTHRLARAVGIIGLLPLFTAAGAVMIPTVVGGGFAVTRTGWSATARRVCLLVAAVPVVFVGHDLIGAFGWSLHALGGIIGMLAVYGLLVRMARCTFAAAPGRGRTNGWPTVAAIVVVGLLFTVLLLGAGGG